MTAGATEPAQDASTVQRFTEIELLGLRQSANGQLQPWGMAARTGAWLLLLVLGISLLHSLWRYWQSGDWEQLLLGAWMLCVLPPLACRRQLLLSEHHLQLQYAWPWLDKRHGWRLPLSELATFGRLELQQLIGRDPLMQLRLTAQPAMSVNLAQWLPSEQAGRWLVRPAWPVAQAQQPLRAQFTDGPALTDGMRQDLQTCTAL